MLTDFVLQGTLETAATARRTSPEDSQHLRGGTLVVASTSSTRVLTPVLN